MKKAFTMLELIFVIVVVGILSFMVAGRFERNSLREAADQLVSHIRYTQHLAMMDNRFNPNAPAWFVERWMLDFCDTPYRIARSDDSEIALDLLDNSKNLNGYTNKRLDLKETFGVQTILTSNGRCRLIFDELGRPYPSFGIQATMVSDLLGGNNFYDINISNGTSNIVIRVSPETGYTHILPN